MSSLFLRTVCLVLTATRLTTAETAVCSDGWIYYPHSNKCLQTQYDHFMWELPDFSERQCSRSSGGEFSNTTGSLVDATEMETFLTDFLRFKNIRRVIVRLPQTHIRHPLRYKEPYSMNAVMLLIASRDEIVDYKWNRFQQQVVCSVDSNVSEPQNSSCPTIIKVEDVRENNITLFLKPGPIKSKLVIKVMSFEECSQTQPNCRDKKTVQEYAIFPSKELKFTVKELQTSTQYSITFEAEGTNKEGIPCKQTVNITTKAKATYNEELNPTVIGLSVGVALSILGIAVLAFLYFRLHRQMQNGNNSLHLKSKQTEGNSLKVCFKSKKTTSPVETVSTLQSSSRYVITIKKNEGVGEYSNIPATAPNVYDQGSRDKDEHFYERT